jgi:PAS domain S-box-containing protein
MAIALEVLSISTYKYIRERDVNDLLFILAISCMSIAGMQMRANSTALAVFSSLMGLVFLSLIFIVSSKTVTSDEHGLGSHFSVRERLKETEMALQDSRDTLKSILENAPNMVLIADREGKIQFINRSERGFDGGEVVGTKVSDYTTPGYEKIERNAIEQVFLSGKSTSYTTTGIGPSGGNAYYETSVGPVKREGEIQSVVMITSDITERKRTELELEEKVKDLERNELATLNIMEDLSDTINELRSTQEALRESEETFRAMASAANDAVIMMDNEGRTSYWNAAAERIFGYTKEEILGKELHRLIAPEKYHNGFSSGFVDFRITGRGPAIGKTVELTGLRKDGIELPIELSLSGVKIKGFWNAIGLIRDLSERKRAEEELIRSEKLAGIGTLASGIAHEINNPLAGITGYAEIILDQDKSEPIRQYTHKIIDNAQRAAGIVRWLSRYSKQSKDSNVTDVDVHKVIEESLEALKHTRSGSDIEIIRRYGEIPRISGNHSELQQVFINLLNNAVDAMHDKGTIGFSTGVSKGFVEVRISDDGEGISENDMNQIFNPFFTTKETGKGTGLGLYVSSMIVKKHRGTIEVSSGKGRGTKFTMRFPIAGVGN